MSPVICVMLDGKKLCSKRFLPFISSLTLIRKCIFGAIMKLCSFVSKGYNRNSVYSKKMGSAIDHFRVMAIASIVKTIALLLQ